MSCWSRCLWPAGPFGFPCRRAFSSAMRLSRMRVPEEEMRVPGGTGLVGGEWAAELAGLGRVLGV